MLWHKLYQLFSTLCSLIPYLCWAFFLNRSIHYITTRNWTTVMMMLCGLSLVYFIILQPLMNFYSLLLYLEKPPGEIKEQYGSVFANWLSESLERLTNNTFGFLLGQFANVLESFEYPWSFDRTVMVLSGLLNVCQFVLLLREMAFNRRFASLCCPEICGVSSEALAKSTPSRSRNSKTAKASAAATAPARAASQAEATAPPQSSSAKVAADNITSPASKANKAAPPSSHTGHCCCCNHSNHCDSHSNSGNESNDGEPLSASVAGCKKATEGQGESSQFAEVKAIQLALDIAERERWPILYLYTDSWMVANALWGWLQQWKKSNWQRRGKPIWAATLWQDIAARLESLPVKVRHVDAQVPKSRATEEHLNNQQADQAAKIKVAEVDLDWQHKGELFLARWAHDASGHQGRDATYKWARDRGVDLTMDTISQVIHECETCAEIKQAKRLKPVWYGG
ncbi:uncharacterized protein LOC135578570 [Columba livia]|uniref:uncharacterized protein LOC135578570 n=1 Tax=Columba livia TaxID=8932 RepID=UPI0031BA0EE5